MMVPPTLLFEQLISYLIASTGRSWGHVNNVVTVDAECTEQISTGPRI